MSTPQETVMEIVALAKQGQSLAEQARDLDPSSPDYKQVMIDLGHVIAETKLRYARMQGFAGLD